VISGVHHPAQILAYHATIANRSARGRHIIASKSAHWVQFDEPELIVEAVREIAQAVGTNQVFPESN
jgi:pimeloyl-ACP methyl ester carboxylesterase